MQKRFAIFDLKQKAYYSENLAQGKLVFEPEIELALWFYPEQTAIDAMSNLPAGYYVIHTVYYVQKEKDIVAAKIERLQKEATLLRIKHKEQSLEQAVSENFKTEKHLNLILEQINQLQKLLDL